MTRDMCPNKEKQTQPTLVIPGVYYLGIQLSRDFFLTADFQNSEFKRENNKRSFVTKMTSHAFNPNLI